jgi:K+-sensing histidine kinase KdpD
MSDVSKPTFEQAWAAWISELSDVAVHATSSEHRARIARVKQAFDGDDVLEILCHDVKDPLAAVLMGVTLLQKSPRPAEAVLDMIATAARRLDRVVTSTNDLARLRRGEFQVRVRALPIASLVATAVENQRKTAASAAITLDIANEATVVVGDPSATSRILSELLQNAVGFSGDNPLVEVSVTTAEDRAIVRIADSGPGIDEAHLPFVFDEMRNRKHRPRRGIGRGLPIALALAELQNATLTIGQRAPRGCVAVLAMQLAPRSETTQS